MYLRISGFFSLTLNPQNNNFLKEKSFCHHIFLKTYLYNFLFISEEIPAETSAAGSTLTPRCSHKITFIWDCPTSYFQTEGFFSGTMKTPAADFVTSSQHAATWQHNKLEVNMTENKRDCD